MQEEGCPKRYYSRKQILIFELCYDALKQATLVQPREGSFPIAMFIRAANIAKHKMTYTHHQVDKELIICSSFKQNSVLYEEHN